MDTYALVNDQVKTVLAGRLHRIDWDGKLPQWHIARDEREQLQSVDYWLCVVGAYESDPAHPFGRLQDSASYACWALQLTYAVSAKRVFLHLRETASGFDIQGLFRTPDLTSRELSRLSRPDADLFYSQYDLIYQRMSDAIERRIVRLQNPINLIEYSLRMDEANLGALMCTMGLDMLFMTDKRIRFRRRVGGFLGLDTLVFSPVQDRQPATRVRDVLEDVYLLRAHVAHGKEIPEKFRKEATVLDFQGCPVVNVYSNEGKYRYSDLMFDSSLAMLRESIRRIFVEGLVDCVADVKCWKSRLEEYEAA